MHYSKKRILIRIDTVISYFYIFCYIVHCSVLYLILMALYIFCRTLLSIMPHFPTSGALVTFGLLLHNMRWWLFASCFPRLVDVLWHLVPPGLVVYYCPGLFLSQYLAACGLSCFGGPYSHGSLQN